MSHSRLPEQERAILVQVKLFREENNDLMELEELVISAQVTPIDTLISQRDHADPKYYIGSGKASELAECAAQYDQKVVIIFNNVLSPSQQRNLEQLTKCRVLDRTEVILAIFALRARTHEGKLQVELAQLSHLSTRLIRGWTHLERQKGGIGLRGPGETQLETDRRLIRQRIKVLTNRIQKVRVQRAQGRNRRNRSTIKTVALVGYTNVGKSSLFNYLCCEKRYVENQLFATLDPTLRQINIPQVGPTVIADTVGFIRALPHSLVSAFRATLDEVASADLLLHVVDAHHPDHDLQIQQVQQVLHEIGADTVPQLLVYNKIDLIKEQTVIPRIDYDADGKPARAWVSVRNRQGLSQLLEGVGDMLSSDRIHCCVVLLPTEGRIRAQLYKYSAVVCELDEEIVSHKDGGCSLEIKLPAKQFYEIFGSIAIA